MKKVISATLAVLILMAGVLFSGNFAPAQADSPLIYEFNSMVGVPQAFTGAQAPIRGINGGGIPWMLTSANGRLLSSGLLEINVNGLVLAAGANSGINPIANFRAIVSCLTSDGNIQNVTTDLFPATTGPATAGGGDARIHANLTLPQPCIAPIVFVTSPGGAWFAATGK
jgi:hypothetical protein